MLEGKRLLIYSHDSFGLGHLRRCRAIAHDLVDRFRGLSVLILSGSPIIGSFDFKARVDFVRVPGVWIVRASGQEELRHDGRHAAEMAGAIAPAERLAQALDVDPGRGPFRIHLVDPRRPGDVDARVAVGGEVTVAPGLEFVFMLRHRLPALANRVEDV